GTRRRLRSRRDLSRHADVRGGGHPPLVVGGWAAPLRGGAAVADRSRQRRGPPPTPRGGGGGGGSHWRRKRGGHHPDAPSPRCPRPRRGGRSGPRSIIGCSASSAATGRGSR